jgi:Rad51
VTASLISILTAVSPVAWELPEKGLGVFYGLPEAMCLFHYFLPHAILQGQRVLCLDGANRFDPLLIARFARERKLDPAEFGSNIRVARAFTCFQLTELLARLPRLLQTFPAQVAVVTALPDLYFDEDVREREAIASFQRALQALKAAERLSLPVAVFTDATSSHSPRRALFQNLVAQADQVVKFSARENMNPGTSLVLTREKFVPAIPV